jgi:hypothetical protein
MKIIGSWLSDKGYSRSLGKGHFYWTRTSYMYVNVKLIRYQFWCIRCAFRLIKSRQWYSCRKSWIQKIVKTVKEPKSKTTCVNSISIVNGHLWSCSLIISQYGEHPLVLLLFFLIKTNTILLRLFIPQIVHIQKLLNNIDYINEKNYDISPVCYSGVTS